MHDPTRTSVLYAAPVDEDGALYDFCSRLREAFLAADLLVPDTRPMLLHATILNTVYASGGRDRGRGRGSSSGGRGSGHGRSRGRLTIDAREILERYADFEWVRDAAIEKVAICRMGAVAVGNDDEEYVVEGEVALRSR